MSEPTTLGELADAKSLIGRMTAFGLSGATAGEKAEMFAAAGGTLLKAGIPRDAAARAFFVPGRIEVLGKHTDYAGGRSIVAATERGFCVVAADRDDATVRVFADAAEERAEFRIGPDLSPTVGHWSNYPMTVARRLAKNFGPPLRGAEIAFRNDLPPAAGMSSSSALLVSSYLVLAGVNGLERREEYRTNIDSPEALAGYLGTIENGQSFGTLAGDKGVGTFGGSEDHTAILCCRPGQLAQYSYCPVRAERSIELPGEYVFAVASSGVVAEKTGSARQKYNRASALARAAVEVWNAATERSDAHLAAAVTSRATIGDLDTANTILVWCCDLKETLPVLYLRVRKAVLAGATLVVVSPVATGLDSIATHTVRYRAGSGPEILRKLARGDSAQQAVIDSLGEGPVVALVGRTSITENPMLSEAVAAFARALPDAKLMPLLSRANIYGALDMGLAPTLLPGRASTGDEAAVAALEDVWGPLPEAAGKDTMAMLEALIDRDLRAVVLVGADPIRECPDPALAESALNAADFIVAFDAFVTDSTAMADVILPIAVWGEIDGTVTNLEGRVQRLRRSVQPRGRSMTVTAALDAVARSMGSDLGASDWQIINKEIAATAPAYAGLTADFLTFEAGEDGAIVPLPDAIQPLGHIPVDVSVPVVNDRFTLHFAPSLYDAGVLTRHAESLRGLVAPVSVRMHPKDAAALTVREGTSVSVGGTELPVVIDDDVHERSVVLPHNHDATRLVPATPTIRIETLAGDA